MLYLVSARTKSLNGVGKMKSEKRKLYAVLLCCVLLNLLSVGAVHAVTTTIATFADPAADGSMPLLEIDFNSEKITSRWDDNSYTGLTLNVMGTPYDDVFFVITDSSSNVGVGYTGPVTSATVDAGEIEFFDADSNQLLLIEFKVAQLTFTGLAGFNFMTVASDVIITGSAINDNLAEGESLAEGGTFSFALSNHTPLGGDWNDGYTGYTTTSAFSCSANIIPEPATIGIMGIGWLITILGRKKRRR